MVELGLIGCGGMGRTHAQYMADVPGVRLRACADISDSAAQKARDEFGAEYATTDWTKLLSDDAIQGVIVATHHHLHRPMVVAAAEAGKPVLVEKPLALTEDDLVAMERAVAQAGIPCIVGYQARFSPFIDKLKEVVPRPLVTMGQLIDPHWGEGHWANDPIEGGGNVLSQGCHLFDLMYWLNESEPVVVYAEGGNFTHPNTPITDSVCVTLRYANGSVGSAVVGDFGTPALLGKAAYQVFDGKRTATLWGYYFSPEIRLWGADTSGFTMDDLPEPVRNVPGAHGYTQELEAFAEWITTGEQPRRAATVRDGVRATRIALAAIRAIETREPQSLPQIG
ncbi:Gfo/Idh/MocA family oxidoreductase [Candidatus Poribacteria bacterium]|nr:Gfo/Idh/MocA family oxidoreductase [Candidatus Poribacteria bacterium]